MYRKNPRHAESDCFSVDALSMVARQRPVLYEREVLSFLNPSSAAADDSNGVLLAVASRLTEIAEDGPLHLEWKAVTWESLPVFS